MGLLVPMGISNFGIHVLPGLQYMYVNTMAMKFPVRYHQLGFQKKGYFSNSFKHPFLEVKYAPGPCLKCTLLQGHVCHMLLEHYAFQMWSWSIFNLEYSSRLLIA